MADIEKVKIGDTYYNINDPTKLPLTGGTLTSELIIDAQHRDTYYASNLCRHFYGGTPTEFVIKTRIKFASGTHMPVIRIYGYAYGENSPIELRVGFYIYDDTLGWAGAVSTGAWKPDVYLFRYTEDSVNYVAVGFRGACYFCGFQVDAQVGALGAFNTNFSTIGWTTLHNGTDTSVILIPAVGTDKCVQVDYKTMKTDISGSASYATYAGSANAATYATNDANGNNINNTYLKLSGGIMSGALSTNYNALGINFRGSNSTAWDSWVAHETSNNEALVFGTQNANTSIMFVNGENYGNISSSRFQSLTPGLQIMNNKVMINRPYSATASSYNLDVTGTINGTTIYQNGTQVQTKLTVSGTNLIIN